MKSKPAKKTVPQDATKKVFDVMRPGKTPVSPTSRPVIVGHKPQVKDPMMSDRDDERPLLDSAKKVTIEPAASATAPTASALPPTDSDSAKLPSASASLEQEGSRAASVAGGASAQPDSDQSRSAEQRRPLGGEEREPTSAEPELAGGSTNGEASASDRTRTAESELAEKPAEPSTAESVATIATSSVVDDVPPAQEPAPESPQPANPITDGTKTSGLVFDELDDRTASPAVQPSSSDADSGGLPSANPSLAQEDSGSDRSDATPSPVADGTSAQPDSDQSRSAEQRRPLGGEEREPTSVESELAGESTDQEPAVTGQAIVSHHKQPNGAAVVLVTLVVVLLLAIVLFDILLDLGILNMSNIPHTNFFPN